MVRGRPPDETVQPGLSSLHELAKIPRPDAQFGIKWTGVRISIISPSRRADIPAFYILWFINRIRAGHCTVVNPAKPKRVSRVSLKPEDVDVIVSGHATRARCAWKNDVRLEENRCCRTLHGGDFGKKPKRLFPALRRFKNRRWTQVICDAIMCHI
jgi:hypothetical protein